MGSRSNGNHGPVCYESIMGFAASSTKTADPGAAVMALSRRLATFRQWLAEDAKVEVSPALCIVNGEATDGTKNAPVLVMDVPKPIPSTNGGGSRADDTDKRFGVIDEDEDRTLYDRTMGCQVRAVRSIEKDEILLRMPRSAFITPDLVASSDAGRAVLSCCKQPENNADNFGFWDCFENTTVCESRYLSKAALNAGPQLLVKILQERKRVEMAAMKRTKAMARSDKDGVKPSFQYTLAEPATISSRAPLLAFIIHQRFSNEYTPFVQSQDEVVKKQFVSIAQADDNNAFKTAKLVQVPPGSPDTFAPYARTLPSSVGVPLCWKRSELALLSSNIPGTYVLQEVAARTLQLAAEYTALLEAGILERFPKTFPKDLLTWDRWVWAAATVSARFLPATAYIDKNTEFESFRPENPLNYQSPPEIWSELGVLIPLMDMFNHEVEENQVTWEPPIMEGDLLIDSDSGIDAYRTPRLVAHKRIKKGSELFTCYGLNANHEMILQYGFAQVNNASDHVKLGWGLSESVGNTDAPADFQLPVHDENIKQLCVFDTTDEESCRKWWTEERIRLLEREAFSSAEEGFMESLKNGKKMTCVAHNDGSYHPILLSALIIATMPQIDLQHYLSNVSSKISLTKSHQTMLQCCLAYFFSKKLEKLLQNVSSGLKHHFAIGKLWTGSSHGGIHYKGDGSENGDFIGWQMFMDSNAYQTSMEIENHYYAMGVDSCVLALLDGQLQALQSSLDGVTDTLKFQKGALCQIQDLGFSLSEEVGLNTGNHEPKHSQQQESSKASSNNSKRTTRDDVSSMKLHVGNLAFSTSPTELFNYFVSLYGKSNILDCYVPMEKDDNRSRGFGFITMPASLANEILDSEKKHEMDGRLLKLAKSNSTCMNKPSRYRNNGTVVTSNPERCAQCGYRPKYCTCIPPGGRLPLPPEPHGARSLPSNINPPDYRHRHEELGRPSDRYRDVSYRDGPREYDPYYDRDRFARDFDRYSSGGRYDGTSRSREDVRYGRGFRPRSPGDGSDEAAQRRKRNRSRSRSPGRRR